MSTRWGKIERDNNRYLEGMKMRFRTAMRAWYSNTMMRGNVILPIHQKIPPHR